ncbi:MAG: V-type ATPase subunit, partial [Candidatus Heimdallarchaeota archaeon]
RLLASTLEEGISYLQTNPRYSDSFDISMDPNSSDFTKKLEKLLLENVYNEILALINYIPKKSKEFIIAYLRKSYIDAIKYILRMIHEEKTDPVSLEEFFVLSVEDNAELIVLSKSPKIEEVIEKIQTQWVKDALKSVMVEYFEQNNILLLEHALDQAYYSKLWDSEIPSLSKRDRKIAEKILGMQIDLNNISTVLRGVVLNLPREKIETQLLSINYRLGSFLDLGVNIHSFSETINALQNTVYSDLGQAIYREYKEKDRSIVNIELLQQEWFLQSLLSMLASYPFHIGILLSYLIFRFQEIDNLRIIFETKWKEADLKLARELLIYFQ